MSTTQNICQTFSMREAAELLGVSDSRLADELDRGERQDLRALVSLTDETAIRKRYGRRVLTKMTVYQVGGYQDQLTASLLYETEPVVTIDLVCQLLDVGKEVAPKMLAHHGCKTFMVGKTLAVLTSDLEAMLGHSLRIWPPTPATRNELEIKRQSMSERVQVLESKVDQIAAGPLALVGDHDNELRALYAWAQSQGFDPSLWSRRVGSEPGR